jgi:hypothetical protein
VGTKIVGGVVGLGGATVGIRGDWVGINPVAVGTVGEGLNTAVMVRSGVGKTGSVGAPRKGKLQARPARTSSPTAIKTKRLVFIALLIQSKNPLVI